MRKLAILLGVLAMATAVQASTMEYKMLVNNQAAGSGPGGAFTTADLGVPVGGIYTFSVAIQVKATGCPDDGGVNIASFNLADSTGSLATSALNPVAGTTTTTKTKWMTTNYSSGDGDYPWTTARGLLPLLPTDLDVTGQTGSFAADTFADVFDWVGAGVFTTVCTGNYTWDGNGATLTLVPVASGVWIGGSGSGVGEANVIIADAVTFVPEPVTMSLLVIGGLGLLARRNRRA